MQGDRAAPGAHPRSRGENLPGTTGTSSTLGSSPLTRGKPVKGVGEVSAGRLIPAHAGKTVDHSRGGQQPPAHPRSRGENSQTSSSASSRAGSSPLTRGKPDQLHVTAVPRRLIPAHAGKTRRHAPIMHKDRAHPRSRGENCYNTNGNKGVTGSSPLTRGKRCGLGSSSLTRGLIPAHAGKTVRRRPRWCRRWAHPRSRGENEPPTRATWPASGSSPLTRGKPRLVGADLSPGRLIPAHAGKTCPRPLPRARPAAHPRSRGENQRGEDLLCGGAGSSPLTRGKPSLRPPPRPRSRLIPAHAGKTTPQNQRRTACTAHPRSRGENYSTCPFRRAVPGSSTLTRGKQPHSPRLDRELRLIPAHAGKTSIR